MHTRRRASFLFVGGAALIVATCGGNYRFDTRARYQAPTGGFEVAIHARGFVRSGADLSEESVADVRVTSLGGGSRAPIELQVRLPSEGTHPVIVHAIQDAGYPATATEFREVDRVIDGALRGPKATLVQGQTRVLRVIETSFSYPWR
jgi:hypothetical protein